MVATAPIGATFPNKYSLIDYAREIENQKDTGSCVANATCSALELLALTEGKSKDLSRLFVYWNIRAPYEQLKAKDGGAYLRDGFKMVNKFGVPSESDYKFLKSNVNTIPPKEIFEKALDNKAIEYKRVYSLNDIKSEISSNRPVIFSTALGEMFYYLQGPLAEQKYKAVNNSSNQLIGYHAMSIVGYDDTLKGFIVENSWSELWGNFGFCLIPYSAFFADAMDAWVCTRFDTDLLEPKKKKKKKTKKEKMKNFLKWIFRRLHLKNKK